MGSESEGDRAAAERWARVRGLTGPESSSSSSEDESESDKPGEGVAIVSDEEVATIFDFVSIATCTHHLSQQALRKRGMHKEREPLL